MVFSFQKRLYVDLDEIATDLNLVFENAKKYNADESNIYKVGFIKLLSDSIKLLSDSIKLLSDSIKLLSDSIKLLSDSIIFLSDSIKLLSENIMLMNSNIYIYIR